MEIKKIKPNYNQNVKLNQESQIMPFLACEDEEFYVKYFWPFN
jgi:hypothetical protein